MGFSGSLDDNTRALTLHWNGTRWQALPSPSPPNAELLGVAATSPSNVWAVGSSNASSDQDGSDSETLILHWSGKKWHQVASPQGTLSGVAATSPTNAWAIGATDQGQPLILHWNGKKWQQTPGPSAGNLSAVAATSPTNAWVVGGTLSSNSTLVLHWNGKTWQQTPSPSAGADQGLSSYLGSVAALSRRAAWAVGEGDDCGCGPGLSLIARWNGKVWSQVPNPTGLGGMNLTGVTSLPSGRAWAVGLRGEGDSPTTSAILQWNGSAWTQVPIPALTGDDGGLSGVVATSRTNAWAVGWASPGGTAGVGEGDNGNPEILILHWNGSAWTPMTAAPAPEAPAAPASTTTTTTLAPTTTTTLAPTTTTTSSSTTTTPSSSSAAGGPLLGSAAWGQALGSFAGISGFGEVAPANISLGGVASSPQVESITWSNWGAAQATGQGQSIDGNGQSGPVSDWPLKPVTVVAFDLGSCSGGPPAYQEVTWYFPGDGQTFNSSSATNACTGQ